MNRFLKTAVLSAAVAATTLAVIPGAQARDRWHHRDRDRGGEIVAAGVIGLATGALIAGAANSQPRYYSVPPPRYYEPQDSYYYDDSPRYYRPAPVRRVVVPAYSAGYDLEPWSPEWYRYCENRYRSFDPRSGTFVGYDGVQRFCAAN
jgi:hypothetical protein